MIIDFRQITGPCPSKQENFQELCSQLVLREYPEAKPVEGKGGDAGIDIYEGVSPSQPTVVWQVKFFLNPLKEPQKRQIRDSYEKVADSPSIIKWTLCLPRNLNPSEQEWVASLGQGRHTRLVEHHRPPFLDWWGETKLRELLVKYPDIAIEFFPSLREQPPEKSLVVHSLQVGTSGIEFMLSNLSDNVLIVEKLCLEVLRWQPFNMPPPIAARVMTYRYEVKLKPRQSGEYLVSNEEFKYAKGDVDKFAILCSSPPGNKYTMKVKFYCNDIATKKRFIVYSEEFGLRFYNRRGSRNSRLALLLEGIDNAGNSVPNDISMQ